MKPLSIEEMWEVIDGTANADIVAQHEQLMAQNEAYRTEYNQYASLSAQLKKMDLEEPSMRFTQNVMDSLLPKLQTARRNGKSLFFFLAGMAILVLGFLAILMNAQTGNTYKMPFDTEGVTKQIGGIVPILSNSVFIYSFLIINGLIFFNILDKKIFKPYFEKRLNQAF
jgi:hypothetical protein